MIAVAAASGLDNLEVDITNQSLLVQGRTPAGTLMTVLRVVRSSSRDFARLVAVHRLVEDLAAGRHRPRRGDRPAAPDPAAEAALAAMVRVPGVRRAGGLRRDAARRRRHRDPARAGVRVDRRPGGHRPGPGGAARLLRLGRRRRHRHDVRLAGVRPRPLGVAGCRAPRTSPTSSPAASSVLLPGRAMASSVEDAITGYPVTGAGRLFGVLLTAAGIIVGVAAGLSLALRAGHALDLGLTAPDALVVRGRGRVDGGAGGRRRARWGRQLDHPAQPATPRAAGRGAGRSRASCASTSLHGPAGLGSLSALALACVAIGFGGRPARAAAGGARPGAHRALPWRRCCPD